MGGCTRGKSSESNEVVEELYREFLGKVLPTIKGEPDEAKRYLILIGWITKRFEELKLGRIVITGGFAVEVYTGKAYRTMDVDIIVEGVKAKEVLERLVEKFSDKIGRGYLPRYDVLEVKSIDIVSVTYEGAEPVKVTINDYYVYLEPPEDLIAKYLSGWKFWGSTEDRDKALWLYIVWKDKLDMKYLEIKVQSKKVKDKFEELKTLSKELSQ